MVSTMSYMSYMSFIVLLFSFCPNFVLTFHHFFLKVLQMSYFLHHHLHIIFFQAIITYTNFKNFACVALKVHYCNNVGPSISSICRLERNMFSSSKFFVLNFHYDDIVQFFWVQEMNEYIF